MGNQYLYKTCTHKGLVQYKLDLSIEGNDLEICLTTTQQMKAKKYCAFFTNKSLPSFIKEEIKTTEKLFNLLQEKKNFVIDPINGKIILFSKKKEIEISLMFQKEVETRESKIEEEFGDEMSELEFP